MRNFIIYILLCSTAFGYIGPVTNFNTGQVSPLIEARGDFSKYSSSCRTLENMFVTVQGPALKRPGTKYIATSKVGEVRLIPFEVSTDDAYILEFGDNYIRFYRNGAQILTGVGEGPVEIETPYDTEDLFDLNFVQTDNEMYIASGSWMPQVLRRTSHTQWSISRLVFRNGPFYPESESGATITPSDTTGSITLTASRATFESTPNLGHVASLWQILQVRDSSVISGTFEDGQLGKSLTSPFFIGEYSFSTTGAGTGTVSLMRSTSDSVAFTNALTPLTDQLYDNPSEVEEDGARYRVVRSGSSTGVINYVFTIADNTNPGVVRINEVLSSTTALASVITPLVDTSATTRWREGYWSGFSGWPETLAFYQQRLVFAGSELNPQTMWFGGQNPDDYANFREGTFDTSAFTVALGGQNPIRWLLPQDFLLVGTSGTCGKWGNKGAPVTPTSPNYQEQTRNGASNLPAVYGGDDVLYVERGGRKVRRFGFDFQTDKYLTPELTVLSPEITESGIVEIAFQSRPNPILWCVLDNGDIATITHQPEQSVVAWTKQVTDGEFESVAVISSGEQEDEVWVSVKRVVNGNTNRYIEQFQPNDWGSDDDDLYFVDSGLTHDDDPSATFTGLEHLEGETVKVWADGIVLSDEVVLNGEVTIDVSSSTVAIGLPYTAKIETLPIRVSPQDISLNKKIKRLWVDLYKSGAFSFGPDSNAELTEVNMWEEATLWAKTDLYTSTVKMKKFPFTYAGYVKQTVYLESSQPTPFGVRSIVAEIEERR